MAKSKTILVDRSDLTKSAYREKQQCKIFVKWKCWEALDNSRSWSVHMTRPIDGGCLLYRYPIAPHLGGGDEARGPEHQVRPPDGRVRVPGQCHLVV